MVLDALGRTSDASALSRLGSRLPARLRDLAFAASGALEPSDTLTLDDAEELLLAIDQALGDGSGRVLESVARDMAARAMAQRDGVVVAGDLLGTIQRLRAPLEHPFIDAEVLFEVRRTETGLTLVIGVTGRPRAARLLRHFALGYVRAAAEFCRETSVEDLRISSELLGDRARIGAAWRRATATAAPPPFERRSLRPRTRPSSATNVAAVVDQILDHSRRTTPPPPPDYGRRVTTPLPAEALRSHPSTPPPPPSDAERRAPDSKPSGFRTVQPSTGTRAREESEPSLPPPPRVPNVGNPGGRSGR